MNGARYRIGRRRAAVAQAAPLELLALEPQGEPDVEPLLEPDAAPVELDVELDDAGAA